MNLFQGLKAAREFGLNGLDGSCPDKGSRFVVPSVEEIDDGFLQIVDAEERTSANTFGSQFSEPAFDEIEPTGTGGHKVRDETRMSFEPGDGLRMLMRTVVIHHQVQGDVAGKLLIESAQKPEKFLVPMPLIALANNPAL